MYAPYGFRRHVIETRAPLGINEEAMRRGAEFGNPLLYGEPAKSVIFVPLVVGDEAKGHISLQDLDREHAFSDSDVRLLSTLASSMAVALENARLFEETKRLLAETEQRSADLAAANADLEQRTAELTLINGVQQALASQLDLQAFFDLVGDKIRDIFDAQIVDIGIYDRDTGLLHFPYWFERGVRYPSEPIALFGIRKHVMETRQPLVINSDVMQDYASYGFPPMTWGEIPKSLVFVPLVVGDEAKGYISLQDLDREHAFSDSDVRLLSTLAASMSVALENARLFGETRRLLAETEQRAAELETVNRIGQALGAELELAALIELTGEQIRQTFAADIAYVALREGESNLILFPYYYEHGARSSDETMPYGQGLTSQIIMSGKPLLLNERIEAFEAQTGIQPIGPRPNRTSACRSWLASGRSA